MKKSVKTVLALMLAFMMVIGSQESFFAAQKSWYIDKPAGRTNVGTEVSMDIYTGTMTYQLINLEGTCSYMVTICEPHAKYAAFYYMNNDKGNVCATHPGKVSFKMAYSSSVDMTNPPVLSFYVWIDHDSNNLGAETMNARGTIGF